MLINLIQPIFNENHEKVIENNQEVLCGKLFKSALFLNTKNSPEAESCFDLYLKFQNAFQDNLTQIELTNEESTLLHSAIMGAYSQVPAGILGQLIYIAKGKELPCQP